MMGGLVLFGAICWVVYFVYHKSDDDFPDGAA